MIWTLNLKPSEWSRSLVYPLTLGMPVLVELANDPASLPADLLDEVVYMMQAARHVYEICTADPLTVLAYMRSSSTRWELVQRIDNIQWGIKIPRQVDVLGMASTAARWPVKYRWVKSAEQLNLSPWQNHDFSTIGHSGVCEDCGVGRAENVMHKADTPSTFRRIDDGSPRQTSGN